tara:strand:- start:44 stop:271 length:228 start_codon:yes stop_codon:yes gene_type:complete
LEEYITESLQILLIALGRIQTSMSLQQVEKRYGAIMHWRLSVKGNEKIAIVEMIIAIMLPIIIVAFGVMLSMTII